MLNSNTMHSAAMRAATGQGFRPVTYELLTDQPVDTYDRDPEHEIAVIRAFDASGNEMYITNADIYYYTVVMEREQALAV
jgi:hypothetical protein